MRAGGSANTTDGRRSEKQTGVSLHEPLGAGRYLRLIFLCTYSSLLLR